MDAKTELVAKLCGMFPGAEEKITETLAGYLVTREADRTECGPAARIAAFLAAKRVDGLTAKTLKNYREMLGAFSSQVDKPAEEVTTDDIRGYLCYLADERRLKNSSIQTHINTLRSFFAWLVDEEVIVKNPMRRIKSLRIDRTASRHPLTAEELEQLRLGCKTDKEKALVEFLVSSGCRLSEVAGISVEQIDWKNRSVAVIGKGNKARTVYFSVRAKLLLETYLAGREGGAALFAASKAPHKAMSQRAIQKAVQRIGERAGEQRRIHPHLMRHTFASNALNAGMDITVIQRLLGHTDPKTTMIYAELREDTIRAAYDRVVA